MSKFTNWVHDADERRIASFVGAIIMFVLSCVMSFVTFGSGLGFPATTGAESLAWLIVWPVALILYLIMFGFAGSAFTLSFRACFSSIKAIKIISIILTVLSVAMVAFNIYMALNSLNLI